MGVKIKTWTVKKKKQNFKTRYKTNKLLLFSAKSCLTLWDPK